MTVVNFPLKILTQSLAGYVLHVLGEQVVQRHSAGSHGVDERDVELHDIALDGGEHHDVGVLGPRRTNLKITDSLAQGYLLLSLEGIQMPRIQSACRQEVACLGNLIK